MQFASILSDGKPLATVIDGDYAIPLIGHTELGAETPKSVLDNPELDHAARVPKAGVQFLPVVPHPRKVICVGLNYRAHVAESLRDEPTYPVLFTKFARSLTGAFDRIACPVESSAIDYEGELALVIGQQARRLPENEALTVVAGYTASNDISMRDYQNFTHQWLQGKAWEASTPIGPTLVTPDEAGDPNALTIRTIVNGIKVQEAGTNQMIFPVARLVSTISQFVTLEPGDIILTGTPDGVGFRREPRLLLSPGDEVTVEIDGVGSVSNRMVAEGP